MFGRTCPYACQSSFFLFVYHLFLDINYTIINLDIKIIPNHRITLVPKRANNLPFLMFHINSVRLNLLMTMFSIFYSGEKKEMKL